MRMTLNRTVSALTFSLFIFSAPAFAVGGLSGTASGSSSGGVNTDSIGGSTDRGATDPVMEERENTDGSLNTRSRATEDSIDSSGQASMRDQKLRGEGGLSADSSGASGGASADTEEAEE